MANMAQEFIKGEKLRKNVGFFNVDWRYNYITHRIETNQDFRGNLKELQVMMKKEPYFYIVSFLITKFNNVSLSRRKRMMHIGINC